MKMKYMGQYQDSVGTIKEIFTTDNDVAEIVRKLNDVTNYNRKRTYYGSVGGWTPPFSYGVGDIVVSVDRFQHMINWAKKIKHSLDGIATELMLKYNKD